MKRFSWFIKMMWRCFYEISTSSHTNRFVLENTYTLIIINYALIIFGLGFLAITIEGLRSPEFIRYGELMVLAGSLATICGVLQALLIPGRINNKIQETKLESEDKKNVV